MESRHIQYIGKKASKPDNVCRTNLIWRGAGDTKEVPSVHATVYLEHPDIWRDVTEEVLKTGNAPALEATVESTFTPESIARFSGGREEQIMQAIQAMDETNAEHFDANGIPSIAVVEQILGYEITPDELGLVMQDIQKARDENMGLVAPEA